MPELQDAPDMPLEAVHIWNWYRELEGTRTSNGFTPNPLSFLEIRCWAELTGQTIRASEFRLIVLLDQLWREAWNTAQDGRRKFDEQKRKAIDGRRTG